MRESNGTLIAVVGIMLGGICLIVFMAGAVFFLMLNPSQTEAVSSVALVATATPLPTFTSSPTFTPPPPTATPTETPRPTETPTALPTDTTTATLLPPTRTPLPTATPTQTALPPTVTPLPPPTATPPPSFRFAVLETGQFPTGNPNFDIFVGITNAKNIPQGGYRLIGFHSNGLQYESPVSAPEWTENSGAMHYKAGNIKYQVLNSPTGIWTLNLVDLAGNPVAPPVEFTFNADNPSWYFLLYGQR